MENNKIKAEILKRRYLLKDAAGNIKETESQMYRRVAKAIACQERTYGFTTEQIASLEEEFYQMMKNHRFLPNSPTLMNAARANNMLSACFVLPVEDSIDSIFDTVKNTALIQKAGGGTGFDFSRLRPTGDLVRTSGGTTSGPVSFMRVLSEATSAIQQGAFRRGANMGQISVNHPDILNFIYAKKEQTQMTNFNLSVKVTNDFMSKLENNPNTAHIVINPRTKEKYCIPQNIKPGFYTIKDLIPKEEADNSFFTVKQIWEHITKNAHISGEPGVCFIDKINENNPTPALGKIEATNPCGEQPLLAWEACNLGSLNLAEFINDQGCDLAWKWLEKHIKLAVHFLTNVAHASNFPLEQIEKITHSNRKIGLGIMGFADLLVLLGIPYDSEKAIRKAEQIAAFIQEHAHKASEKLSKTHGCFLNWKSSIWNSKHHRLMCNAAVTTIAPTGTISLIAGCNGGIEPFFDIATRRKTLENREFIQLQPVIEKLGRKQGWLTEKVRQKLTEGFKPEDIPEIPKETADAMRTAHEIAPEWHVRIQAAFQKHVDNAVSKTVNLPADATVEDVDKTYRKAFQLECKGCTVYRDTARDNQVISSAAFGKKSSAKSSPRPRPKKTTGYTIKTRTGCGTLFITVNRDKGGMCEVFASLGKAGGCPAQSEATCRAVSAGLRSGVKPEVLIEQLKGIRCLSTVARKNKNKDIEVLSCPDAIAKAMEESIVKNEQPISPKAVRRCPICNRILRRESNCEVCECGFTKCG